MELLEYMMIAIMVILFMEAIIIYVFIIRDMKLWDDYEKSSRNKITKKNNSYVSRKRKGNI